MNFNTSEALTYLYSIECPSKKLALLKHHFEKIINSKRTYHRIKSLSCLLKTLHKRNVLADDSLKIILEIINPNLIRKFHMEGSPLATLAGRSDLNSGNLNAGKMRIVQEKIKERIGDSWYDFARYLDVPEKTIDELDKLYTISRSDAEIIERIFLYHEKNCPLALRNIKLLDALGKASRNDIRHDVESILLDGSYLH